MTLTFVPESQPLQHPCRVTMVSRRHRQLHDAPPGRPDEWLSANDRTVRISEANYDWGASNPRGPWSAGGIDRSRQLSHFAADARGGKNWRMTHGGKSDDDRHACPLAARRNSWCPARPYSRTADPAQPGRCRGAEVRADGRRAARQGLR